jgi:hypothetical protein
MEEKFLWYTSVIEFTPNNKIDKQPEAIVEIEDYNNYKSFEKAQIATFISALNILEESLEFLYPPWH